MRIRFFTICKSNLISEERFKIKRVLAYIVGGNMINKKNWDETKSNGPTIGNDKMTVPHLCA